MVSRSLIGGRSSRLASRHLLAPSCAAAIAIFAMHSPAMAFVDLYNNGAGTLTWEDDNNWIAAIAPTAGDDAFIDSGYVVTSTGNNVANELQVGVSANAYGARGNDGGKATININAGSLTTSGNLVVGQAEHPEVDSSGVINVATGATLTVKGGNTLLGFFGDNAAGLNNPTTGTINVNGGTFAWNAGDTHATLWLGGDSVGPNRIGQGFLNVNGGTVTGAAFRVGDYGSGTFTMSAGTFSSNFYMSVGLGNNPSQGHGTVNVSGGVLNLAQITLNENKVEECVFNQSGGTVNIGGVHGLDGYNFRIGYSDKGKGTYNMTGGTLNVSGNDLYIGRGKSGELNISGNSAINVDTLAVDDRPNNDYGIALGGIDNGSAVINQNGGTVFIAPTSLLGVFFHNANGGVETYNLAGGTLTTNGITAEGGTTVKTLNFNGGSLIANKSFTVPNPARTPATANFFTTLSANGGTINTGGFDVTWTTPLTGSGALTKTGIGSLILSGVNTYAGATLVSGGTLIANNTASGSATGTGAVSVSSGATLGGTGTIGGNASISGTIDPGAVASTGTLSIGGTLAVNAGGAAAIQLTSASDYDRVAVTGAATLTGDIQLSANGSYVPAYGQTHRVLTASAVSGHFGKVIGNKIAPKKWLAVTYDATGVNITAAQPGDANLSGLVNFDDLISLAQNYNKPDRIWTQGDFDGNGVVNFDDLISLAQNYNHSNPADLTGLSGAFASDWALAQSLVPEPTVLSMLIAPIAFATRRRKVASRSIAQ